MGTAWEKWRDDTVAQLRRLIADEIAGGEASGADYAKARKLAQAIATTVERGNAAAWRRLAVAFDVVALGDAFDDREPARDAPVDSTMPAAKFEVAPSSHSVDETVAVGALQALDLDDTDADARRPAGSTLMAGQKPSAGSTTRPIPVHMPSGVTASGAASTGTASTGGGTTPMQPVPSSVLDLEKYAVLCAWTEAHPERREHLHVQYGLESEEERKQLDARFEALFASNLQLRSAFQKRFEMHLGFLRRGRG